jgi:multiple sugar transport system substrate-binding protein
MTPIHTWYTCCYEGVNWDVAAIPSFNGNITAKLHADTFAMLKAGKNQEAAFEVYTLMTTEFAEELAAIYGFLPAKQSAQGDALAKLQEANPNVNMKVFLEALSYPDNPNHESGMPNFLKASDTYGVFGAKYQSTPGLDIDVELDALRDELQKVFDEVK